MTKAITLSLEMRSTISHISIGAGQIKDMIADLPLEKVSSCVILTDTNVSPLHLPRITSLFQKNMPNSPVRTITVPPGESSKSMERATEVLVTLAECGLDRTSLLICLGGGVISDLGGFVASVYQRGIRYVTIPTTLEAMVDASVGGKTGVNVRSLKNYIGTFYPASSVLIDPEFLHTLPQRAFTQGFAEVIKHGLIQDRAYVAQLLEIPMEGEGVKDFRNADWEWIIQKSIEIKRDIVQKDPHESGARRLLNFGHTVGHAIESLSFAIDNPLFHGEAVALGMIAETHISMQKGFLRSEDFERVHSMISHFGLPSKVPFAIRHEDVLKKIKADKKTERGLIQWTLLESLGSGIIDQSVDDAMVHESLKQII